MVARNTPREKRGRARGSDEAANGSQDLSKSVHLSSEVCKRTVVDKDHGRCEVDETSQDAEHGGEKNDEPSHLQ